MTSIEWLYALSKQRELDVFDLEQAQAMHKAEIIKAFDESENYYYQYLINHAPKFDSETYYQETFKNK
jgi:hypothetical protein